MTQQPETRDEIKVRLSNAAVPLQSVETEEALLGCLINAPEMIPEVAGTVQPGDFFTVRFNWLFDAILTLWRDQDVEPDLVTIANLLRERGQIDEFGGEAEIMRLKERIRQLEGGLR